MKTLIALLLVAFALYFGVKLQQAHETYGTPILATETLQTAARAAKDDFLRLVDAFNTPSQQPEPEPDPQDPHTSGHPYLPLHDSKPPQLSSPPAHTPASLQSGFPTALLQADATYEKDDHESQVGV